MLFCYRINKTHSVHIQQGRLWLYFEMNKGKTKCCLTTVVILDVNSRPDTFGVSLESWCWNFFGVAVWFGDDFTVRFMVIMDLGDDNIDAFLFWNIFAFFLSVFLAYLFVCCFVLSLCDVFAFFFWHIFAFLAIVVAWLAFFFVCSFANLFFLFDRNFLGFIMAHVFVFGFAFLLVYLLTLLFLFFCVYWHLNFVTLLFFLLVANLFALGGLSFRLEFDFVLTFLDGWVFWSKDWNFVASLFWRIFAYCFWNGVAFLFIYILTFSGWMFGYLWYSFFFALLFWNLLVNWNIYVIALFFWYILAFFLGYLFAYLLVSCFVFGLCDIFTLFLGNIFAFLTIVVAWFAFFSVCSFAYLFFLFYWNFLWFVVANIIVLGFTFLFVSSMAFFLFFGFSYSFVYSFAFLFLFVRSFAFIYLCANISLSISTFFFDISFAWFYSGIFANFFCTWYALFYLMSSTFAFVSLKETKESFASKSKSETNQEDCL